MDGRKEKKEPSIHTGHRQRMKSEYLARGGIDGMVDHRVLELLLFYAIPQGDVNPLAHRLMDRFGSLLGVLRASDKDLLEVKGMGLSTVALLRLVLDVAVRYEEERNSFANQIITSYQFKQLLRPLFFNAMNERAYLVCMDGSNRLLDTKELGDGVANAVQITVRKVLEAALSCNATRVVLAHNHISGVALPSEADVATTLQLRRPLREAGVELVDHVIYADGDMVSMAESGLLREN